LTLAFVFNGLSQDAEGLLSKLSEKAKTYKTIDATYSSKIVDLKNNFTEEMSGHILIEDNKFKLDLGEFVIISNGVTVWTFETETNDCYLDDAEMLIEEGMDPTRIFTIWEDDFKTEWKGHETVSGRDCVQINLYPDASEDKPYHTMQLFVDETALEVVRIVVKGREGMDTEYLIDSFETGVKIPTSIFTFETNQYPGATIIDNRI
jgi:outer membrane lipoprotein-sorting protein